VSPSKEMVEPSAKLDGRKKPELVPPSSAARRRIERCADRLLAKATGWHGRDAELRSRGRLIRA